MKKNANTTWMTMILTLGLIFSSCGNAETDARITETTETEKAQDVQLTEAVTEPPFDPFANLPEKDYDGYSFRVLVRPLDRWISDIYVEKQTGDTIDDSVYQRNSLVQEKYNIEITYLESSDPNIDYFGQTAILAGEDAYDIMLVHGRAAFFYANGGMLLDWNQDLPYVDLAQPWWDQDARDSFSINHKLYVMIGDFSHCALGSANVMLFNKELLQELSLETPYQKVRDGIWTYDVFEKMARQAAGDLDGNGKMEDETDQFGYVTQKWVGPMQAFVTAGLRVLDKDEQDIPYISFLSEKTQEVFDWYFDLIESDDAFVDVGDVSWDSMSIRAFEEGVLCLQI